MIKTIIIFVVLIVASEICSFAATIAIIKAKNLVIFNEAITAFRTNCNARFVEYDMEDKDERGEQITKKIAADKPDMVFVLGTKAALVARKNIKDIPVIFSMVFNPENYDLNADNISGIAMEIPVVVQLRTLKSIVPKISKVGVIYNPKKTNRLIDEAMVLSKELGFTLVTAKVDSKEDVTRALRAFAEGIDAFWMLSDPSVWSKESFETVLQFTIDKRVPFLAYSKAMVQAGALVSLAINYSSIGQQACTMLE